jgi:hypothetical protein
LNLRPSGYEPDELPGCSTPRGWVGRGAAGRGGWRTWRRPTLPRLGAQYHGRGGVSRPSSGWARVGHPRCRPPGRPTAPAGPPSPPPSPGCWQARHGPLGAGPGPSFRSIGSASGLRSRPCGLRAARLPLGGSRSLGRLGPVSSARRRASTPGLSTWWSPTALKARPGLEGGFPLRCLQRLSRPGLATRLRGWRHDRSTRGPSAPVLSYWGRPLASLGHPRQIGTELSHDVLNPAHVPL